MKKYILLLICLATINISANTENEARKILDNQQRQLNTEQNRLQQELRKKNLKILNLIVILNSILIRMIYS